MDDAVEREIRELRSLFWSDRDPDGRAFAPLADAYRRVGDYDGAAELLSDGLDRHPSFSTAYVVAGRVHRDRGAPDEAEEAFRRALALDHENVIALHGLGRLLRVQGDQDEAEDLLARAAELGFSGEAPADTAAAATEADEPVVTAAGPEYLGVEEETSRVDVSTAREGAEGGPGSDVEDSDRVQEGVPESAPRTRTMAELYERQGLRARAIEVYEHLLRQNPGDEEIRNRLGELREQGQERRAAAGGPVEAETSVDEELEATARDMSESGHHEPVESPFSWTGGEEAEEPASTDERPVSEYFATLLSWEPGQEAAPGTVTDVEELAGDEAAAEVPEPSEAAEIEELPPSVEVAESEGPAGTVEVAESAAAEETVEPGLDQPTAGVVEVEALAPDEPAAEVVDIGALAPDEPAGEVVDIGALAPDEPAGEVVDIGALAPDEPAGEVVDIGALAPDEPAAEVVDIGALAPDEPAAEVVDIGALAPDGPPDEDR